MVTDDYFAYFRHLISNLEEEAHLLRLLEERDSDDVIGRLSIFTRLGEIMALSGVSNRLIIKEDADKGAYLRGLLLCDVAAKKEILGILSADISENLPIYHLLAVQSGSTVRDFVEEQLINETRNTTPILQLASLLKWEIFSQQEIQNIIGNNRENTSLIRAAFDYSGELGFAELLRKNKDLVREADCSVAYSYLDALYSCGETDFVASLSFGRELPPALNSFKRAVQNLRSKDRITLLHDFAGKTLVAQTVFQGDPLQAGRGSAGGVGTLLATLGEELASSHSISGVCTITAVPTRYWNKRMDIVQRLSSAHTVLRIPVCETLRTDDSSRTLYTEMILRLRHSMRLFGIQPGVFHLRYADFATLAAFTVAREQAGKVVYTVTPDPHRKLSSGRDAHAVLSVEKASEELSKVFISDWLVRLSDGLIGIGGEKSRAELESFFPELRNSGSSASRRLSMLAEGVIPGDFCPLASSSRAGEELLFDHAWQYKLSRASEGKPIILTVGRLNRLKGQHRLVKAWANSGLSELFNLVLIGGDLDSPSSEELDVLNEIDRAISRRRELEGAFCHLGALDNRTVRCLQNVLARSLPNPLVHVYVAPSLKEEFGLAILEAMSAGFLAIAPEAGGASTYIQNGTNGFLINTVSSESIQEGLEKALISRNNSPREDLKQIAARGMDTVLKEYNLKKIAGAYARYYSEVAAS